MNKKKLEVQKLLENSEEYYLNIIKKKYPKFDFKSPVILFGAANMGRLYLDLFKKNKIKILCFCDNDKIRHGKKIKNIKIISPDFLKNNYPKDTQIVITAIFEEEIKKQLKIIGFNNIFSFKYFSFFYPKRFNNPHWQSSIHELLKNKRNVLECLSLFKELKSINTFINVTKYRLLQDRALLKKIVQPKEKEYFDDKIIKLSNEEVFLDGGAYNGDTLEKFFKKTKGKFAKVYAFEPDSINFKKLRRTQKFLNNKNIEIFSSGLGRRNSVARFSNEGTLGSRITKGAMKEIKIVKIDSLKKGADLSFIKLDIEGNEKEALLGAKKIINKKKPKLAICIYHLPQDLWELPLLIKKMNPGYKFFLRHYTEFLYDTVLYAV